jgi:hypothetical protein
MIQQTTAALSPLGTEIASDLHGLAPASNCRGEPWRANTVV